ncbi:MAG: ATP-binding protein [Candidatus Omnitrophota bacterium]|nr:ATP-binding protein [Candidatus Omnitrophota bacterium]
MLKRYLEKYVLGDLKEKMVFISGPRQVGKTTFAKQLGGEFFSGAYSYLNWDNREDRKAIIDGRLPAGNRLYIFDEVHKYRGWKNYLKGQYDKYKEEIRILVTGSARLDIFKKGGDSLLGRYHSYRLHPFSIAECLHSQPSCQPFRELTFPQGKKGDGVLFDALFKFGGFPEVFIKKDERSLRRWHNQRIDRLVKEDIRDVENIRDLSALQVLVELLPRKVGALFSLNSLREDLNVAHKTVAEWVEVLERFYYHFRIYPFQSSIVKSIRKEPKLYLWDWSEVADEDARLENIVASHLLKFCHFLYDVEGWKAQLYYLRDKEQREVDFLVAVENRPWFCVEVKKMYRQVPVALKYFASKLKVPFAYEVVREEGVDFFKDNARIMSITKFLSALV